MTKRNIKLLLGIVMAIVASFLATQQSPNKKVSPQPAVGEYRVVHVYDGDTIKLDNGERVRLIGIDTPESKDNPKLQRDLKKSNKSKNTILALGRRAADFSEHLLMGQDVRLEFDVEQRDRYQRLLAYVYLADGTFVNEKIIREGYAYPMTIPPNVKYAQQFKQWFQEAREQQRGLWNE